MLPSRQLMTAVCVAIVCLVAYIDGQEGDLSWAPGADGAIPVGAIQSGSESDGSVVYVCRGALGGGTQVGKIASGLGGCMVAYRGRELMLKSYEVLAHPARRVPVERVERADSPMMRNRAAIEAARIKPLYSPPVVPPTPPDSSTKRGFDDQGRPYVDVRLPDGTIKRTQDAGVTLIKPDGSTEFIPNKSVRMNAPAPTPPSLPDDPAQGRAWVERHNAALLDLIRDLVARDDSEMQKFASGEQQAVGDDLFKQIGYRTTIAEFLATQR
jgi:Protein of unknown function (DUF3421)